MAQQHTPHNCSNYIDPPERTWLPAFTSTLFALATVLLALRIWLRFTRKAGGFGLDDILMLCAWLAGLMYTTMAIISASTYHTGRNNWDILPQHFEPIALLGWLTQLAFLTSGACTKIAVLLFYRRLVKDTFDSRWRIAVFAGIGFIATYTVAIILVVILRCSPVDAAWTQYAPGHEGGWECVDTTVVNFLAGVFAILSDLYAVILPMLMTRHFDLPSRQKWALNILFALGALVVGASAARTYYTYALTQTLNVARMVYNATACSQFELQLGIICASLPALRVFLRRRRGAVTSTTAAAGPDPSATGGRIAVPKLFNDMDLPEEDKTELASFHRSRPMHEGEGEGEQGERDVSTLGTEDSGLEEMEMEMPPRSPTGTAGTAGSTKPLVPVPVPLMRVGSPAEYEAYSLEVLKKGKTRYERERGGSRGG
ncbi:hypothetical protein LTR56_014098 [Elasticomyces elasticus]|nr:hypothetical protein LTR56_014098 [Elasticomyces elasticus]KAK3640551.1 hypothetical protein LTR22_016927 [Elasticomyces elasticus]KAK4900739.1 hypothetical protein LTR49_027400 [Elasticomyces elasticus]KAK5759988.1 hypothetical protein LTS12_009884 [Elasticomyces elasticus]